MTAPDLTAPPTATSARIDDIKDDEVLAELTIAAEGEERTTWFVWLLVLCCSLSGLLFGSFILFVPISLLAKISRRLRHWRHIWRIGFDWERFGS